MPHGVRFFRSILIVLLFIKIYNTAKKDKNTLVQMRIIFFAKIINIILLLQ